MNDCNVAGGGGSEVGEKWSGSGYTFNIDPTRFADRMDRGVRGIKMLKMTARFWPE